MGKNLEIIPKYLFAIWFGSDLPVQFKNNIMVTTLFNPDYQYHLYTDSLTLTNEEMDSLRHFCQALDIDLIDIAEKHFAVKNLALVRFELSQSKLATTSPDRKKVHYARASDNLRLGVLYSSGGIYFEPDLTPLKGFGDLASPQGVLVTHNQKNNPVKLIPPYKPFYSVEYCFIAARPNSRTIELAIDVTLKIYEAFQAQRNRFWLADLPRELKKTYTCSLTGSALSTALNCILQNSGYDAADFLLPNQSQYFSFNYTNSWLTDDHSGVLSSEDAQEARNSCLEAVGSVFERYGFHLLEIKQPTNLRK